MKKSRFTDSQSIEWRGKSAAIRCDNGSEYISQSLISWANKNQITLVCIQPGKPTQNAYIERFNRTARQECLDLYQLVRPMVALNPMQLTMPYYR